MVLTGLVLQKPVETNVAIKIKNIAPWRCILFTLFGFVSVGLSLQRPIVKNVVIVNKNMTFWRRIFFVPFHSVSWELLIFEISNNL